MYVWPTICTTTGTWVTSESNRYHAALEAAALAAGDRILKIYPTPIMAPMSRKSIDIDGKSAQAVKTDDSEVPGLGQRAICNVRTLIKFKFMLKKICDTFMTLIIVAGGGGLVRMPLPR